MDTINAGGKELPVCFSMRAINQFCRKHKMTVGDSFAMLGAQTGGGEQKMLDLSYDQIADLFYFGLKEGHRKENKKLLYSSSDDVLDLFDEEPGLLATVIEMYGNSLARKWAADGEAVEAASPKKAEGAGKKPQ